MGAVFSCCGHHLTTSLPIKHIPTHALSTQEAARRGYPIAEGHVGRSCCNAESVHVPNSNFTWDLLFSLFSRLTGCDHYFTISILLFVCVWQEFLPSVAGAVEDGGQCWCEP